MAKTYWVFWTYQANYASNPTQVTASNFVEAIQAATTYDPYGEEGGKRIRLLVFEEGGSLVWDGPAPRIDNSPGNVVIGENVSPGRATILGVASEDVTIFSESTMNELAWLYDVHIARDTEHKLPDHMVPFERKVKWACMVGNEDAPHAIYLSTKPQPEITDPLYRFK
jgi:hypothetical protein